MHSINFYGILKQTHRYQKHCYMMDCRIVYLAYQIIKDNLDYDNMIMHNYLVWHFYKDLAVIRMVIIIRINHILKAKLTNNLGILYLCIFFASNLLEIIESNCLFLFTLYRFRKLWDLIPAIPDALDCSKSTKC